jgi:hypothetical protein
MFATLSKSLLLVSELISAIPMLGDRSRLRVNTPNAILFSVAVLTTVASCAECLELEVFGG